MDDFFIGADDIIIPAVPSDNNIVIGARIVMTKDNQDNSSAVGHFGRVIGSTEKFIAKKKNIEERSIFKMYCTSTTANKIISFYGVTGRHNDSFLCDNIQFFAYRKTCTPSCYRTT